MNGQQPDWAGLIQAMILLIGAITTLVTLYVNSKVNAISRSHEELKRKVEGGDDRTQ